MNEIPRRLSRRVAPEPKGGRRGLRANAKRGPLGRPPPRRCAERGERAFEHLVFFEAEGVDLPEILGIRRFNFVGKLVQIRGVQVEVVGVTAGEFTGLDLLPYDFWAPVTLSSLVEDGPSLFGPEQPQRLVVTGRLRPGQTPASAKAALMV